MREIKLQDGGWTRLRRVRFAAFIFIALLLVGCSPSKSSDEMWISPALKGEKWGYINEKGDWVIKPQYRYAYKFSENGLAAVVGEHGEIGYIDVSGNYVIDAESTNIDIETFNDYSNGFSTNGLAVAVDYETKLFGYIDQSGEWAIKPKYQDAGIFGENGLAAVIEKNEKIGFIDAKGNYVIDAKFIVPDSEIIFLSDIDYYESSVGFAPNGLSAACDPETKLWGYIYSSGEWAIEPKYYMAARFTNRGVARVFYTEDKYCFIDKSGNEWDSENGVAIQTLPDGEIIAQWGEDNDGAEALGFVNNKGEWVIPPQFDVDEEMDNYSFAGNGLSPMSIWSEKEGDKWGVINKKGKWVVKPKFDLISGFTKVEIIDDADANAQ